MARFKDLEKKVRNERFLGQVRHLAARFSVALESADWTCGPTAPEDRLRVLCVSLGMVYGSYGMAACGLTKAPRTAGKIFQNGAKVARETRVSIGNLVDMGKVAGT